MVWDGRSSWQGGTRVIGMGFREVWAPVISFQAHALHSPLALELHNLAYTLHCSVNLRMVALAPQLTYAREKKRCKVKEKKNRINSTRCRHCPIKIKRKK